MNNNNKASLKSFFIKLIAITVSIIIIINMTYNLIFAEKFENINKILMLNEKKLNEIKMAAREYAENKFSIEKVVDMELELYNSIFVNQ